MNGILALCFGVCGVALASAEASAADWPTKPVRIIVPFAAGGAADAQGRLYGDALSAAFGRQFVVENRTGGGGLIAAEAAARAAPDAPRSWCRASRSRAGAGHEPNMGYDPMRDFTHIAYFGALMCWWCIPRWARRATDFVAWRAGRQHRLRLAGVGAWATGSQNISGGREHPAHPCGLQGGAAALSICSPATCRLGC